MRLRGLIFALSLIIAGALAHASGASSQDYPFPEDQPPGGRDVPGMKSPGLATTLSLLGTLAPIGASYAVGGDGGGLSAALLLGGALVGPSLGYFYAGEAGQGLKGLGLRTLALGATIGLTAAVCTAGCDFIWGSDDEGLAAAVLISIAGLATTGVLAGRDIARVDDAVRAHNERVMQSAVSVGLTYVPEARAPGIVLTLRR